MEPRGERGPHKPAKDGSSVQLSLTISILSPKQTRSVSGKNKSFNGFFHHQTSFLTEFIPGNLNVLADQFSRRNQILPTEGTITLQACQPIWERWGNPMVDLFASQYSHRLPLFVSPMRDHKAIGKDALARSWTNMGIYAYPPTSLFSKVLAKAAIERPRLVLIAPFWRASPWFPDLMSLAREGPVFLNLNEKTLVQPRSDIGNEGTAFLNLTSWLL